MGGTRPSARKSAGLLGHRKWCSSRTSIGASTCSSVSGNRSWTQHRCRRWTLTSLNTSEGKQSRTEDQRRSHQNRHWYGKTPLGSGLSVPQQPFDAVTNPRTGFWHNWYGDAEGIVRRRIRVRSSTMPRPSRRRHDETEIVDLARHPDHRRFWPIESLHAATRALFQAGSLGTAKVRAMVTSPFTYTLRATTEAPCSRARFALLAPPTRSTKTRSTSHRPCHPTESAGRPSSPT